jgi:hypothetical protein
VSWTDFAANSRCRCKRHYGRCLNVNVILCPRRMTRLQPSTNWYCASGEGARPLHEPPSPTTAYHDLPRPTGGLPEPTGRLASGFRGPRISGGEKGTLGSNRCYPVEFGLKQFQDLVCGGRE